MADLACLIKISPVDVSTGLPVDIHASNVNDSVFARMVNGLDGKIWEPAIKDTPQLGIALWNGDFQAAVQPASAVFSLSMGVIRNTYPDADQYFWPGARVEIYAETPGTAWPWQPRFAGRVTDFGSRGQLKRITAEVDKAALDKDILTSTYAGTGGAEGGSDIKNRAKPLVIGYARSVEPVLINAVYNVYQFSGYGPIEQVTTLFERGAAFPAAIGDYADYAALVAATIEAGEWGTCLAEGLVRLGAPAFGVITGDIMGHRIGASTPRLTGEIIQALAGIAGVSGSYLDTDSLDAMDAAAPYHCNIVISQQITFLDQARELALACNYQSGLSLTGSYFVAGLDLAASPALVLDARGRRRPQVKVSEETRVSEPYWRTTLGANRCWRVHSAAEIAFNATLIDLGLYDDATTYREGNMVSLADGSRWIYVNAAPSAGNDPPTWPDTSNSWWSNMTPPVAAGDLTYSDNTPIDDLRPAEIGATAGAPAGTYVGSTLAETVESNAADGASAFSGTVLYRTSGAPTNNPSPSSITVTANSNGTRNVRIDWSTYTQGARQADFLVIFWKKATTAPGVSDSSVQVRVNTAGAAYYVFEGINPADSFSVGIAAARRTENGIEVGTIQAPTSAPQWVNVATATANYTANIAGTAASTVASNASSGAAAAVNFNANNDRNGTTPTSPTILSDGSAVDHVINTDGSCDISFEWQYTTSATPTDANNIDGFQILAYSRTSSGAYTIGSDTPNESIFMVSAAMRAFVLPGVAADRYHTFAVRAYRWVDTDVNSAGVVFSSWVKPSLSAENPYRPSSGVAFSGDVSGTINGTAAATVTSNAANGNTAHTGTAIYRSTGAPTNNPSPTSITVTANANGTRNIQLNWSTYTQGAKQADFLIIYWKKGTTAPGASDSTVHVNVNTAAGAYYVFEGVNPSDNYSFGIAAARRTENGLEIGTIQAPTSAPQWVNVATATANYTANVGGIPASSVGSTINSGGGVANNQVGTGAIQNGAVTAGKISVSQLDAISAVIGTFKTASSGARTEISDNVIKIYDASNVKRVQLGNLSL